MQTHMLTDNNKIDIIVLKTGIIAMEMKNNFDTESVPLFVCSHNLLPNSFQISSAQNKNC